MARMKRYFAVAAIIATLSATIISIFISQSNAVVPVSAQAPPVLKFTSDATSDRLIMFSSDEYGVPDYRDLTFSENWPLENRICVPEGCLSIGDIRQQLRKTP